MDREFWRIPCTIHGIDGAITEQTADEHYESKVKEYERFVDSLLAGEEVILDGMSVDSPLQRLFEAFVERVPREDLPMYLDAPVKISYLISRFSRPMCAKGAWRKLILEYLS